MPRFRMTIGDNRRSFDLDGFPPRLGEREGVRGTLESSPLSFPAVTGERGARRTDSSFLDLSLSPMFQSLKI